MHKAFQRLAVCAHIIVKHLSCVPCHYMLVSVYLFIGTGLTHRYMDSVSYTTVSKSVLPTPTDEGGLIDVNFLTLLLTP